MTAAIMKIGSQEFRVMIFYDFQRGLGQAESLANPNAAFGDETPSRATVFRWFAEFKGGRRSFKDEPRSWRKALRSRKIMSLRLGACSNMIVGSLRRAFKRVFLLDRPLTLSFMTILVSMGAHDGCLTSCPMNKRTTRSLVPIHDPKVQTRTIEKLIEDSDKRRDLNLPT